MSAGTASTALTAAPNPDRPPESPPNDEESPIILTVVAQLGPEQGSLIVKTYCEGVAARAGHDLVIEVTRWEATLGFDRIELTADPRSLRVREGVSGVKPLTDKDRDEIQRNIDAKVLHGKPITFSGAVINHGDRLDFDGAVTIAGTERGTLAAVDLSDGRATTTITLRQTDWRRACVVPGGPRGTPKRTFPSVSSPPPTRKPPPGFCFSRRVVCAAA